MSYVQPSDRTLDLAQERLTREKLIENERKRLYEIDCELKEIMDETGATEIKRRGIIVKLEDTKTFDKEMLIPLLEYEEIPPDELDAARTPEKIIPPSWNMTKVKPLARYSERVRAVIDSATIAGEPRIRVTEDKAWLKRELRLGTHTEE